METNICIGPSCTKELTYKRLSLCDAHYNQYHKKGKTLSVLKPLRSTPTKYNGDICKGPKCVRNAYSLGLCSAHYSQQRASNTLVELRSKHNEFIGTQCRGPECTNTVEHGYFCHSHSWQFYKRNRDIDKLTILNPISNSWQTAFDKYCPNEVDIEKCWVWSGTIRKDGYGYVSWKGTSKLAHRISYTVFYNIELNKFDSIDHRCRNRACVNPHHLDLVTTRENNKRMLAWNSLTRKCDAMADEIKYLKARLAQYEADSSRKS